MTTKKNIFIFFVLFFSFLSMTDRFQTNLYAYEAEKKYSNDNHNNAYNDDYEEPEPLPRSPWLGFLFNAFPGFGAGSFLQGDTRSGFLGLTTELSGAAIMAVGLCWRGSLEFDLFQPSNVTATILTCSGFLITASSIFWQLMAPFSFYQSEMAKLDEIAIESFIIAPILVDGKTAAAMLVTVSW